MLGINRRNMYFTHVLLLQENIRKCSLCWFQRFYIAVALFFHCVVPTIVFSGYIYKLTWRELLKEVDSGQSGLQERKKTLAKAFGLISVAFSLFYSPYVVASAVNIYYISRHSSVFNDSNANRQAKNKNKLKRLKLGH